MSIKDEKTQEEHVGLLDFAGFALMEDELIPDAIHIQLEDAVLWEADGLWYAQDYFDGIQHGVIEDGSSAMSAYLWLKRAMHYSPQYSEEQDYWGKMHTAYLGGIIKMGEFVGVTNGH